MPMAEHPMAPEDVQAYVDGELTAEREVMARAHLETCQECRKAAEDVASVSRAMAAWQIESAPASFQMPSVPANIQSAPRVWMPRSWQVAAAAVLAVALVWVGREIRETDPRASKQMAESQTGRASFSKLSPPPASASPVMPSSEMRRLALGRQEAALPPQEPPATPAPMIARTAMVTIVVPDVAAARVSLDRALEGLGGFVGQIDVASGRGAMARLTATVRVPSERLASAIAAFKQLGRVVSESQGGEDVTTQVVDLDARLANARETERRLVQVLQQRTGKVGDVLEVEREISRVRESIERMSAERTGLGRRVTYAAITLEISEEERAVLNLDRPSVARDLRNALVDGMKTAGSSVLAATAVTMRIAPSILLWGLLLAWPAIVVGRRLTTVARR